MCFDTLGFFLEIRIEFPSISFPGNSVYAIKTTKETVAVKRKMQQKAQYEGC